jgi:hypothetical protein
MKTFVVKYEVAPEHAEENAALVRAVYAELDDLKPAGFRYRTLRLEDGVSFLHIAETDEDASAPLTGLGSFRRFQAGLAERCVAGPELSDADEVGVFEGR